MFHPEPDCGDSPARKGVCPREWLRLLARSPTSRQGSYAPPGTQGGRSSSEVSYGAGSTLGTTTTASQSFKTNNSIGLTAGGGFLADATVGLNFSFGQSTTDTQSLDIKKSSTTTLKVPGPSKDGVNHDHDQIW